VCLPPLKLDTQLNNQHTTQKQQRHPPPQRYEAKLAEREGDTAVNYGNGAPSYPVIVSERARNRWGSYRGYKFQPLRPTMNLIPENEGWGGGLGE
jgi:hypothetical protein